MTFPESVFQFGEWLVDRPWIKRVRLPDDVFARYMGEVWADLRVTADFDLNRPIFPVLMWKHKQAMIPSSDWFRRDALFPPSMWRRR